MVEKIIRLSKPLIGKEEEREVVKVLRSGNLASGSYVEQFEKNFSDFLGTRFSVATSSGTTALDVALKTAGIGEGDSVLTTPFTFIATSNAILYQKAKPVFSDIDPLTFNLSPESLLEVLKRNKKIKNLLIVHLFGLSCDMTGIMKIVKRFNLNLIEDCAQAVGAEFYGKKTGTFGLMGTFSFYATKNMSTGEGGMVVCNSKKLKNSLKCFINHGSVKKYVHNFLGYNYRLTNVAAALGICQLQKIEKFNQKRIHNAAFISRALRKLDWLILPGVPRGYKHVFHQYTVRIKKGVRREHLIEFLKREGIETGIFYPRPVYSQVLYKKLGYRLFLPEVEKVSREVVSLPVHPALNQTDLDRVVEAITKYKP